MGKVISYENQDEIVRYYCTVSDDEIDFSFDNTVNGGKFINVAVDSLQNNVNMSKEDALDLANRIKEFFKDTE
ncbi:MAG: hypothetical protein AB8G11_02350 [Saprospiraceae bacterium]